MTNLAPARDVTHFTPRWGIEIFSNRFSNEEAYPHPESIDPETGQPYDQGDVDHDWDTRRAGWIRFGEQIQLYDVNIKWDIRAKPTGEIVVDAGNTWLFGLEMVCKARSLLSYELEEIFSDTTEFPAPSRIVFYIDGMGIDEPCYPVGTVSVTGRLYSTGELYTEDVPIDGVGSYITDNEFIAANTFSANIDAVHSINGGRPSMSAWAKTNSNAGMREVRIWCDANEDGFYGLVFGGYIRSRFGEVSHDDIKVCYDLIGYAEALQLNEYVAGYRAAYRCEHFSADGQFGDCTNSTYRATCFRQGGSSCYVGDWDTCHHNGTLVSTSGHRCPGYSPDMNTPLPYDGWTHDSTYTVAEETGYAWYPYDYYLALQAVCDMMNSLEHGKSTSRPWSLPLAGQTTLAEDVDEFEDSIDLNWDRSGTLNLMKSNSFVEVEGEIMLLTVGTGRTMKDSYSPVDMTGTTVGVMRAVESSMAMSHPAGSTVNLPLICWSTLDKIPPKLVMNNALTEPELKHTVWDTLKSYEDQATSQLVSSPYVAWVDSFRQIQFTEMEISRPTLTGFDDEFQITPGDIIENPTYILSGVCNRVCGQIDLDDSNWVYAELTVNSPGLEYYSDSTKLFGIATEEISNVHLTALKPTLGHADFTTYATNFLKTHAFPYLIEHIAINGFIPDEHYWEWVTFVRDGTGDHRYDPYLRYTDPINRHINLLGCKVRAPDFWLGKDENGNWIESEFIIEGIRWISKVEGLREFVTYLTIGRQTDPQEWVL